MVQRGIRSAQVPEALGRVFANERRRRFSRLSICLIRIASERGNGRLTYDKPHIECTFNFKHIENLAKEWCITVTVSDNNDRPCKSNHIHVTQLIPCKDVKIGRKFR
ncbi:hypothetical protein DICVIV_14170 [Dictyocaulus viviparus]|uniref:Uncharacterized protein n=1 Tax=Dictyocaulus viviparus TaxID=29172 RepID=A0A0D8X5W3_DICVI|nr:hypothetical protein DICVIV_14170 [Dictyocaulus viviparus]